jgi:hypothetical protein
MSASTSPWSTWAQGCARWPRTRAGRCDGADGAWVHASASPTPGERLRTPEEPGGGFEEAACQPAGPSRSADRCPRLQVVAWPRLGWLGGSVPARRRHGAVDGPSARSTAYHGPASHRPQARIDDEAASARGRLPAARCSSRRPSRCPSRGRGGAGRTLGPRMRRPRSEAAAARFHRPPSAAARRPPAGPRPPVPRPWPPRFRLPCRRSPPEPVASVQPRFAASPTVGCPAVSLLLLQPAHVGVGAPHALGRARLDAQRPWQIAARFTAWRRRCAMLLARAVPPSRLPPRSCPPTHARPGDSGHARDRRACPRILFAPVNGGRSRSTMLPSQRALLPTCLPRLPSLPSSPSVRARLPAVKARWPWAAAMLPGAAAHAAPTRSLLAAGGRGPIPARLRAADARSSAGMAGANACSLPRPAPVRMAPREAAGRAAICQHQHQPEQAVFLTHTAAGSAARLAAVASSAAHDPAVQDLPGQGGGGLRGAGEGRSDDRPAFAAAGRPLRREPAVVHARYRRPSRQLAAAGAASWTSRCRRPYVRKDGGRGGLGAQLAQPHPVPGRRIWPPIGP